jgi:hypothetical protein
MLQCPQAYSKCGISSSQTQAADLMSAGAIRKCGTTRMGSGGDGSLCLRSEPPERDQQQRRRPDPEQYENCFQHDESSPTVCTRTYTRLGSCHQGGS